MSKSKSGSDFGGVPNVSLSRSRIKKIGRNDTIQWEDIRPEDQHLYLQVGSKLYHKGGLSPEQLRKFDTHTTGTDGADACVLERFSIGGNVLVLSDRVSSSEHITNNLQES